MWLVYTFLFRKLELYKVLIDKYLPWVDEHGVQCGYILNAIKMEYIQDSHINGLFLTSRNDGKPQETYQAN